MAPRITVCLLLVAALCLASVAAEQTAPAKEFKDVPDVQTDDKGANFIVADGQKWVVLGSEGQRFYLHEQNKQIAYQDPRLVPPPRKATKIVELQGASKDEATGLHYITYEGTRWSVHEDTKQDRLYYHQAETQKTTWDDPREPVITFEEPLVFSNDQPPPTRGSLGAKAPRSPSEHWTVGMVAMVPLTIFLGCLAARIYYLHTYHPEMLFPTKERKDRRRSASGGFKPQKARGKMSQDGKGGRSANS